MASKSDPSFPGWNVWVLISQLSAMIEARRRWRFGFAFHTFNRDLKVRTAWLELRCLSPDEINRIVQRRILKPHTREDHAPEMFLECRIQFRHRREQWRPALADDHCVG